jgi:two-component system nitrate/nitrite sensor histidine kinase NarX
MHVIQEALSNIRKHSKASNVRVQVRQSPNWEFEVIDDGVGFEAAEDFVDSTHVGLSIMKERAMKIGARLDVGANIPKGAKITLTLAS